MLLSALTLYLFSGVLLSAFYAAYVYSRGKSPLAVAFSLLCLCISVYLFGYLMELSSDDLGRMRFWNQVQYLTLPFYPVLWALVSLLNTRLIKTFKRSWLAIAFAIPVATFFFRLTNDAHHWYYSAMILSAGPFFPLLSLGKGPWYIVHNAYLVLCFVSALVFHVVNYRKMSLERRKSFRQLGIGALLPMIGLIGIVLDIGGLGLNYAALCLPVSLIAIQSALFRYDFIEVKSLAREKVFENSVDPMILVDEARRLTDYNLSARFLFPELASAAPGAPLSQALENRFDLLELLDAPLAAQRGGLVYGSKDGRFFTVGELKILNRFGTHTGSLIRLSDCTEARRAHEQLLVRATTDELTGLFNRGAFMARAHDEYRGAVSRGASFSLLMIDIDHFKAVNDTYGHAGGDEVLRFLGRELRSRFRATDIPARIGGEEFAVFLPGAAAEDAVASAEKFRLLIADSSVAFERASIAFTLSIGVATYPCAAANFEAMMKLADHALYASKSGGRNRTTSACSL